MSPVFSDNIGTDETVVFGPADKFISGGQTYNYSLRIDFTTPFLYRPTDGNLLVDFRVNGGAYGILDAWDRVGDSVGSVAGNLGDLTGTATTIGLATRLEGIAVPEPSPYPLLISGGLVFFLFRKALRPSR